MEYALARYFDVTPEASSRFRARIKQLQRLEFPSGVNVGRGAKMPYGAEHLVKLVLAFELIDCGMTAKPASELIERHWREFQIGLGTASLADPTASNIFASIQLNALEDTAGSSSVVSIDDENSRRNLEQLTPWGTVAHISMNLSAMVQRLLERTAASRNLPSFALDIDLHEWGKNPPKADWLGEDSWFRLGGYDRNGVGQASD